MKCSIKQLLFVIIIFICQSSFGKNVNNLLFSLNNKIYTTIDLENRINYLRLINSTLTNYEEILDDYIKVIFFDQYYRDNNENENELFDIVNKYYKDLIKNNEKINSQNNYKKDIIFQQIKLDMQRKIMIEREFDKYRDLIFTDNISEINNIYNIYISYISIDNNIKEKLESLLNKEEFRDGWFKMGDLFRRNADGSYDFVDRAKYLIKSGGENIYPAEIERVLLEENRVAEVVVVRKTDKKWGEVPVAVVARKDPSLTEQELLARCRERLAGYKQPKQIIFIGIDAMPRSTTGKIQRRKIESLVI